MNYYDEEITIGGPDTKNLSSIKVDKLPINGSGKGTLGIPSSRTRLQSVKKENNSSDDDGLLQDVIDRDYKDEDEDDSDIQQSKALSHSATQRPQTRSEGSRSMNLSTAKPILAIDNEISDSESEDDAAAIGKNSGSGNAVKNFIIGGPEAAVKTVLTEVQLNITPEKWENLDIEQEVKDLFPYILKYAPQNIEVPYHLQAFIPEYVPAVGDVDAFLKVMIPPPLQLQREKETSEHLRKMGLYLLDEPSGEQSEPSLLNMKLRSVLTGSRINRRSASASLIPTAKSPKDIDKWITEVEQVHMTQSIYDAQPRKDIEPLLIDWPRTYADAVGAVQEAYQSCLQEEISLTTYINTLCQCFDIEGLAESQVDYILNVQTLFALYLAANQAWE